jgi:Na+-transporting NADH:ubiquinone oxidoreductase subunit F
MTEIIIAVLVVAALSSALAIMLLLSEAVLINYGICTITINDEDELEVEGGKTLLQTLMDQEIFVPSACGGRGSCGLCKVKILEGAGPVLPTEEPQLTDEEMDNNMRLSCQVKVRKDLSIELPEEVLDLEQYEVEVAEIIDLNYDTRKIRLDLIDPEEIEFTPGQYIQLEVPPYGKTPEPVYRAYSIASPRPQKDQIELIIRRAPGGICTTYIFELLEEGEHLNMNGPYGEFYLRDTDREIIFVAGGTGIAPILSILDQMAREEIERKATLFYGANEMRDFYLQDELKTYEDKIPNFTYVPVLAQPKPEDEWEGETGLVTEPLDDRIEDASQQEFYLCGSPGMIDAIIDALEPEGLTEDRTFYDKFTE